MALSCPDCGFSNEDSKLFCGACGEPLQGDARVMRDMEKLNEKKEREAEASAAAAEAAKRAQAEGVNSSDAEFVHKRLAKKKDNTDAWLIGFALVLFFIICVCGFFAYEYFF